MKSAQGNTVCLTVIEHFSNYVLLIPLPDKSAPSIANALFETQSPTSSISWRRWILRYAMFFALIASLACISRAVAAASRCCRIATCSCAPLYACAPCAPHFLVTGTSSEVVVCNEQS